MARYHHLPIYRLTYELLSRVMAVTKDFPREYRFTIGQKLHDEIIELVVLIYKANATENKTSVIEIILERIQVVELLIRLSQDMRILPTKHYAALVMMTESLGRQAQGWKKVSGKNTRAIK